MKRLYISSPLAINTTISLTPAQTHYLLHVLRLNNNDEIFVFNGSDGEFLAKLEIYKKQTIIAHICSFKREVEQQTNILFYFAPIKSMRLDYMVQKLTEMGVTHIQPVQTEYTQYNKLNYDRIEANIIEAAQQCGRLTIPLVNKITSLENVLKNWDNNFQLLFCDEKAESGNIIKEQKKDYAILIGPEGGFSLNERNLLLKQPFVVRFSLGKNILRADTAAVASLALLNANICTKLS